MHKGLNKLITCIYSVYQRTSYFPRWRWSANIKGLESYTGFH